MPMLTWTVQSKNDGVPRLLRDSYHNVHGKEEDLNFLFGLLCQIKGEDSVNFMQITSENGYVLRVKG